MKKNLVKLAVPSKVTTPKPMKTTIVPSLPAMPRAKRATRTKKTSKLG